MTLEQAREYAAEHPHLESAMYRVPAHQGLHRGGGELPGPRRGAPPVGVARKDRSVARGRLMAAPAGYRDYERLLVGLDVGSTTVKAVVVDPTTDEILWRDYQRHDTKQPEKVLEFLTRIESDFPLAA